MFYPQANFLPQTNFAPLSHPNAMYPGNIFATGAPQTPFFQLPFSNWQQSMHQPTRQPFGINAFNGIANGAVQPGAGPWTQPQAGLEHINPAWQQFNPALQQALYGQPQGQQFGQPQGQQYGQPQGQQYGQPQGQQFGQPYGHLLQQLAQYHTLIAQQLAQLAAQSALLSSGGTYPFAGQFIPNQLSPNFGPGITMH